MFGLGEDIRSIRIENDLQQSFPIAQIDEDHTTVIPASMDPAGNLDDLTDSLSIDLSTVMGSH